MIKVGIVGYGNLGKGVECALKECSDMELKAVFTRRCPVQVKLHQEKIPVCSIHDILQWKNKIDVLLLCGGSACDCMKQTPVLCKHFHVVDCFDRHDCLEKHFEKVNKEALKHRHLACIASGWDPGFFSLLRLYAASFFPKGNCSTFWGKGISQGHSDALRQIEGIKDARQYTIPYQKALQEARISETEIKSFDGHIRECYIVLEEGADKEKVKEKIQSMPHYFEGYETVVHFVDQTTLSENHRTMPHGGHIIVNGRYGWDKEFITRMELSLKMQSNPYFTGMILCACARAVYRMAKENHNGCISILDIAPKYLLFNEEDANEFSLL